MTDHSLALEGPGDWASSIVQMWWNVFSSMLKQICVLWFYFYFDREVCTEDRVGVGSWVFAKSRLYLGNANQRQKIGNTQNQHRIREQRRNFDSEKIVKNVN